MQIGTNANRDLNQRPLIYHFQLPAVSKASYSTFTTRISISKDNLKTAKASPKAIYCQIKRNISPILGFLFI